MLYTKEQVRDNIRNRQGKRVFYLRKEDCLTAEARDYLREQRIEILSPEEIGKNPYRGENGGIFTEKPEHMTHLNAEILVPKNHPRIRFRGSVDALEAEILLCQKSYPALADHLQELLELLRRLIRCDVLDEPVGEVKLCGLSQQEQRKRSHFPQEYYGIPHFMPSGADSQEILHLNRLRALTRQAEITALDAFSDRWGNPTRPDILQALNRLSSMLYILMLQQKAK